MYSMILSQIFLDLNRAQSIGLFSDRHLLVASRWFEGPASSPPITAGSTIGMLVHIPGQPTVPSAVAVTETCESGGVLAKAMQFVVESVVLDEASISSSDCSSINSSKSIVNESRDQPYLQPLLPLIVQFNVNGVPLQFISKAEQAIQEITHLNPPLYPTVSITSEGTKVWCRLCEADLVYRSREAIGAPPGARVYCLDGSLLIADDFENK